MPASMAACRTVLPLATVTCLPSIVRVTVSISSRSYQNSKIKTQNSKTSKQAGFRSLFEFRSLSFDLTLFLLKLRERSGIAIDLNLADGFGGGNRFLDDRF